MLCVCVGVSFNVIVCGVGGLLTDVVWSVIVWSVVVVGVVFVFVMYVYVWCVCV